MKEVYNVYLITGSNDSVINNTKIDKKKTIYNVENIKEKPNFGIIKIPKINLLENIEVNSRYSHSKNLVLTKEIKNLINESLKTNLSLTEFLREKKFSYKKFNHALELYEKERKNITQDVKTHFKSLRAEKIKNSIKNHKS